MALIRSTTLELSLNFGDNDLFIEERLTPENPFNVESVVCFTFVRSSVSPLAEVAIKTRLFYALFLNPINLSCNKATH